MNRLTKKYADTERYYSTHSCDEVLQKLGKLEDKEEYKPTLKEVKKEWEELGYKWEENDIYIHITKRNKLLCVTKDICITKPDKEFCCFDEDEDYSCLFITYKEHQLLTKTFKALGWEV